MRQSEHTRFVFYARSEWAPQLWWQARSAHPVCRVSALSMRGSRRDVAGIGSERGGCQPASRNNLGWGPCISMASRPSRRDGLPPPQSWRSAFFNKKRCPGLSCCSDLRALHRVEGARSKSAFLPRPSQVPNAKPVYWKLPAYFRLSPVPVFLCQRCAAWLTGAKKSQVRPEEQRCTKGRAISEEKKVHSRNALSQTRSRMRCSRRVFPSAPRSQHFTEPARSLLQMQL